jgi:hypothetical protein
MNGKLKRIIYGFFIMLLCCITFLLVVNQDQAVMIPIRRGLEKRIQ